MTVSYQLTFNNFVIGIVYFIYEDKAYYFLTEFITLFCYSYYRSIFYSTIYLILTGLGTILFFDFEERFKNLYKKILLYDLFFSVIISLSIYFIYLTTKLKLFFIKDFTEHFSLFCFVIYSIIKTLIPLAKQLNYEQSIRSDLVPTIRMKFRRLLFAIIVMAVYCIYFMILPLIEFKYTYYYIENYIIHIIIQIFSETFFFLGIVFIFYPKVLPMYYLHDVVFNYKPIVLLFASIGQKEGDDNNDAKYNISNLNSNLLKKISKKENYPIVFMSPFLKANENLEFTELHIGNIASN
jgi:hypothetical protein